jgi:hypothetical protein
MKNMPSFSEFKQYDDLLESIDPKLIQELRNLETVEIEYPVNEGFLTNSIKNSLSKFFLGAFSSLNMIDEARHVILQLKLDLVKKKDSFGKILDKFDEDIDNAARVGDKDKVEALATERENKQAELEKYIEAQELKISKSEDVASKLVNNKERRRQYLEAGYADDEIKIAELEYKLAKTRSRSAKALKAYEDRIAKARELAQQQAQALAQLGASSAGATGATGAAGSPAPTKKVTAVVWTIDGKVEKRKYSTRKARVIIKRKSDVEAEIADIKKAIDKKIDLMISKISNTPNSITSKYLNGVRTRLLDLTAGLDARVNLLKLFRSLGKTEADIQTKLDDNDTFTKFLDKVEVCIHDGKNIKTGKSKIIADLFSQASVDPKSVNVGKIDDAKIKLNK